MINPVRLALFAEGGGCGPGGRGRYGGFVAEWEAEGVEKMGENGEDSLTTHVE